MQECAEGIAEAIPFCGSARLYFRGIFDIIKIKAEDAEKDFNILYIEKESLL